MSKFPDGDLTANTLKMSQDRGRYDQITDQLYYILVVALLKIQEYLQRGRKGSTYIWFLIKVKYFMFVCGKYLQVNPPSKWKKILIGLGQIS